MYKFMHQRITKMSSHSVITNKIAKNFGGAKINLRQNFICCVCIFMYIVERTKVMGKRHRKPSVPRTKRTLVGYDKLNDVPVVIDTRVPDLNGSREPQLPVEDGDKYKWTCRLCEATTKVGQKLCSLCSRDADKVIDTVDNTEAIEQHIKNCDCCICELDELDDCECLCNYAVNPDKSNVTDGQWKPNDRYDYIIVEKPDAQCIECFIVLPVKLAQDGLRKCEHCRKSLI